MELFNLQSETPNPSECYERLKNRTDYPEAISHFPRYIPHEYKNSRCLIENDFHGYNIHFLKFDADKIVVDDVIKYNKEKKYVSGIIAPKENGTLIFFFANWNIQNTSEPPKINASFEEGLKKNTNAYTIYNQDELDKACAFAEKIKNIVDKEDLNAYADLMKYPLKVNFVAGKDLTMASKQEFLNLAKESIFYENLKNKLKYKDMFANYQGFMLGNGDIWFEIDNKGICKIITLNIIE